MSGWGPAALLVKLEPGPLQGFVLFGHPNGHSRSLTAMRWKAESLP